MTSSSALDPTVENIIDLENIINDIDTDFHFIRDMHDLVRGFRLQMYDFRDWNNPAGELEYVINLVIPELSQTLTEAESIFIVIDKYKENLEDITMNEPDSLGHYTADASRRIHDFLIDARIKKKQKQESKKRLLIKLKDIKRNAKLYFPESV